MIKLMFWKRRRPWARPEWFPDSCHGELRVEESRFIGEEPLLTIRATVDGVSVDLTKSKALDSSEQVEDND